MKVFVSDRANLDLLQLFSYLAEHDPAVAEAILAAIDRKLENLRRFPFIGRERPSLVPAFRSS